jgi:hypothetical protein
VSAIDRKWRLTWAYSPSVSSPRSSSSSSGRRGREFKSPPPDQ